MNSNRIWGIGAVLVMVLVLAGGWFVGISPIVAQGAAADAQTASIQQSNAVSQQKLAVLKRQFGHIDRLQKKLDKLRLSIPEQTEASQFLSELNTLGAKASVTLTSLTIASASIYTAPTPAATSSSTSTDASTAAATPTAAPTTAPAPTTTAPSPAGQFVTVPVQIVVNGSLGQVLDFIGDVQNGQRLYLAAGVSVTAANGGYSATMTGYLFTLQGTSDQPGTTTTTPTDTSSATPTATPTATATATSTPTPTNSPAKKPGTKTTTPPTPGATPTTGP